MESRHPLFGRTEGAQVTELKRDSPVRRLGLREDGVIIGANGVRLTSLQDLHQIAADSVDGLMFDLTRGNSRRRLSLPRYCQQWHLPAKARYIIE